MYNLFYHIGQSQNFEWENPRRKRKKLNVPSNEFIDFLLGQKIKGIRKKTAIAISKQWNSIAHMLQSFFFEQQNNENLTGYDWLYSKNIPNIKKSTLTALCNRLGI